MDGVALLENMLSIPSPSGQEAALAAYLADQMATLGFQTHRDEVGNVIGVVGEPDAALRIVLLGHMDTVPGLVPVRREGKRLYGRGAVDAKGPLAAFVLAAARAAPCLQGTQILVIGATEEEAHSRGAHHLAETRQAPDWAIIGEPSGWQGITIGYKGALSVAYRLILPASHTAGQVRSPAEQAVAFWNQVAAFAADQNQGQAGLFGALDPALREIHTFGDGLREGVEMAVSLRLPPGSDLAALQDQMRSWSSGAELAFPYSEPPFRADKNTPLVRALLRAIRAHGGQPRFKLKTGTSDMNVVGPAWGCPIVAYGPGDSALDHTPQEYVEIDEFVLGIEVLVEALKQLVAQAVSYPVACGSRSTTHTLTVDRSGIV